MADTPKPRTSRFLLRRRRGALTNRSPAKALRLQFEKLEERNLLSHCLTLSFAWGGPGPPPEGPSVVCPPHEAEEPQRSQPEQVPEPSEIPLAPTSWNVHNVVTELGYPGTATKVAIQHDGKIVVAGDKNIVGFEDEGGALLARYNIDGSLDTTFGDAGFSTLAGIIDFYVYALALQADGGIVIAGFSWDVLDFITARFTSEGRLDTDFGVGGFVQTDFGETDSARAVAIQPDGKILVGGDTEDGSGLVRYHSDGSLDATFGDGGVMVNAFGSNRRGNKDISIEDDGRIVVSGFDELLRYNPDGTLDTSFGDGGIASREREAQTPVLLGVFPLGDISLIVLPSRIFTSDGGSGEEKIEATSEAGGFLPLTPDDFASQALDAASARQTEPDTPRPDAVETETVDLALAEITSDDSAPDGIDSLGGSGERSSEPNPADEVLDEDLLPLLRLVNLAIGLSG